MFEDVPSKVRDFFKHSRLNQILGRARASMGLWANRWGLLRNPDTGRLTVPASSIWRHRRYQTMIPGRPGWPPHGRVLFNSMLLLANIPD